VNLKGLTGCRNLSIRRTLLNSIYVADAYGKSTILAANFFLAVDLSDRDYKFGLAIFETYHTILNVNESNNKFYYTVDDAELQFLSVRTKCET